MDKAYTPEIHDQKWQKHWDSLNVSAPESVAKMHPRPSGKNFVMMMPPPNVTGVLHQGHALFLALQDVLARWRRMKGDEVLYLPGSDHASIAVQMQVVKHLEAQGMDYREIGREAFLEKCWEWIADYQPRIFGQIRSMGVTCDWSRKKFTLDSSLNKAVTHAFVALYKKGLIYRDLRLVNWSPKGQTVLSDLEVLFEESDTFLWHLRYARADDPTQFVVVSTTRPETLIGDSAVAVHPEDERYKDLIGKTLMLPFVNREIPVIADSFVDREFGSGAVKITPAHDFTDFEVGKRHGLALHNVFTSTAHIVEGLPGRAAKLAGLERFAARKEIEKWLEEENILEAKEKYKTRIGKSERWGDVVEPYLSHQWFCKMDSMASSVAEDAKSGEITFIPHEFHNQFLRWMEDCRDWCVSRQLWWGHRIPAYYCQACSHVEVSEEAPKSCPKCSASSMEADPDVLDTWFSSGLWPFSTLGWPDADSADFKKFYPTDVLETGFDILFFWVARMLMMGKELTGRLPFTKVYMHPMVRDENGQKMSKTKGNVIDPIDLIKKSGADTLRVTLNALCVQGRDLRLSESKIDSFRNFINKVWNAARFVLSVEAPGIDVRQRPVPQNLASKWILARLDAVARDVDKSWSEFRMLEAADLLYHFLWDDYCDWYLEVSKTQRQENQAVLLYVLSEYLKLLHPVCPHVTEEIWHELPGIQRQDTLAMEDFPRGESFADAEALAQFAFFQNCIKGIRNLRAENSVKPAKKISLYLPMADSRSLGVLKANADAVKSMGGLSALHFAVSPEVKVAKLVMSSLDAGASLEAFVPLGELVDVAEEISRLKKEIENVQKLKESQERKLSNDSFVSRAPVEVVDKEKLKLKEFADRLEKVRDALNNLESQS